MLNPLISHGDFTVPALEYGWTVNEPETGFHTANFTLMCDDVALFPVKHDDVSAYFETQFGEDCKFYVVARPTIKQEAGIYKATYIASGATDPSLLTILQRSEQISIVVGRQIGATDAYTTISGKMVVAVLEKHYFTETAPASIGSVVTPPIPIDVPTPPSGIEEVADSGDYKIVDQTVRTVGLHDVLGDLTPSMYYVIDYIRYSASYQAIPET
jgi:hypothetical protein